MATQGSIGQFVPDKDILTAYTERIQEYFLANNVESAEKQKGVLLSMWTTSTYCLIKDPQQGVLDGDFLGRFAMIVSLLKTVTM